MMSCTIKTIFKALLGFAATKDVRYYLMGVHVVCKREGEILLEATDGNRLLRVYLADTLGFPAGADVILSRVNLDNAQKIYKQWEMAGAKVGELDIPLIDGVFPNTDRVIGRDSFPHEMGISLDLLASSAKCIGLLSKFGLLNIRQFTGGMLGQIEITGEFEGGRYQAIIMGARV